MRKIGIIFMICLVLGIGLVYLVSNRLLEDKDVNINVIENDTLSAEMKPDLNNVVSETTKEYTVCIDPGHQAKGNNELEAVGPGIDTKKPKVSSGTQGLFTKKPEYVLTLEASNILRKKLEEKGIKVIMTRESNEVDISNMERAELANSSNVDLFLRIHADGANESSVKGFHILIPSKTSAYDENVFSKSEVAAIVVLDSVKEQYAIRQSGIAYRSDLSGFNWSRVPTILIEMGFMTNKEDDYNLSNEEYMDALMTEVAVGVEKYLKE